MRTNLGQRSRHLPGPRTANQSNPLSDPASYPPTDLVGLIPLTRILGRDCLGNMSNASSTARREPVLHKIAFQYYPLDVNATSNPFLVSWWPLALRDPALFHVSLQTACLDEELLAQKGFQASGILMADSVSLLRQKIGDISLAVQDGTLNAVITLATIEFGKGNIEVSEMHVEGVRRLVRLRGGINSVRQTSPLTARMISWVSMLIMGHPQFPVQDDAGTGDGIPPLPEWQLGPTTLDDTPEISWVIEDAVVRNAFLRLRYVFQSAQGARLLGTRLHDLACFVIHQLLRVVPDIPHLHSSPITECIRYALILYMFIIQGPTYYSHAVIFNSLVNQFVGYLQELESIPHVYDSLDVWIFGIGLVASTDTPSYRWLTERARAVSASLQLYSCDDAFACIKSVCWLETARGVDLFRFHWVAILGDRSPLDPLEFALSPSPSSLCGASL
ncbi:uncharacterized protein N7482_001451 [Penicillium canariense]|uniref:Uncharacterized protein n=1 Tax=Penicillium canariense TaxID=189055 RepID=A0A9W9IFZ3_9EURO|nr:uncharacterized protein N7482_001451 [Penicillium canariense]KAJ5175574.1 hypothetical protein N7482_001451 [Penicillium canariense]